MKFPIKFSVIVIILFLIPNISVAQKLQARIDNVLHLDDINELVISYDKKHFATADAKGCVVVHDTKTGKSIANLFFKGEVIDIYFTKTFGEVISVFIDDDEYVEVEVYDYINDKSVMKQKFEDLQGVEPELDFYSDGNIVVLSTDEFGAIIYNYKENTLKEISFEDPYIIAGVTNHNSVEFITCSEDLQNITKFDYNFITEEIKKVEDNITPFYLELDLNNKMMVRRNGKLKFSDTKLNVSFTCDEKPFHSKFLEKTEDGLQRELTIYDFVFSPDKKYIFIVGGDEDDKGYVALYNVETGEQEWITKQGKYQTQFSTYDLDMVDNNTVLTIDRFGNILLYDTTNDTYSSSYFIPGLYPTNLDIDPNFERITYSLNGNSTGNFYTKGESSIDLISSNSSVYLDRLNNEYNSPILLPNTQWDKSDISDYIINNNDTYKVDFIPNGKIISSRFLPNKNIAFFSIFYPELTLNSTDDFIKDTSGNNIGIYINGHPLYFQDLSFLTTSPTSEKTFIDHVVNFFYFLDDPEQSFSVLTNSASRMFFPKSGNLMVVEYLDLTNSKNKIFDLENRTWLKLNFINDYSWVFTDEDSDFVFTKTANNLILWNSKTKEIEHQLDIREISYQYVDKNLDFSQVTDYTIGKSNEEVFLLLDQKLIKINLKNRTHEFLSNDNIYEFKISNDKRYISYVILNQLNWTIENKIYDTQKEKIIYKVVADAFFLSGDNYFKTRSDFCFFNENNNLALLHDGYGQLQLIDLINEKKLASIKILPNGEWLVYTKEGVFDASKEGRNSLYYLYNNEVILFEQIKEAFWEPGLLAKLIENPNLVRTKIENKTIKLYPKSIMKLASSNGQIDISLTKQNDDIGRVSLYINGKEIKEDINPNRLSQFSINIKDYSGWLFEADINTIGIKTYNSEGWMSSPLNTINLETNIAGGRNGDETDEFTSTTRRRKKDVLKSRPGLFGLFVGTSKYLNSSLNLDFADKDAQEMKKAFAEVSKKMYDENRIFLEILTSDSRDSIHLSTKTNIKNQLDKIAQNAKPNDIIVLFLSGHGMTIDDDFYYLTCDAGKKDLKSNPSERTKTCFSSTDLKESLRKIKSNKQLMILDACHSGQIAKLVQDNDKALTTSQEKALESIEDKMGVYFLASSESNQKSYETHRLQQGLLTFSLLNGLGGGAADNGVIDVVDLLNFTTKEAERTSSEVLGKMQHPVIGSPKGGRFPIGYESENLKPKLPISKKASFTSPIIVQLPLLNDPLKLSQQLTYLFETRGSFGSGEKFLFKKKQNIKDAFKISSQYKVEGSSITLNWYILKNEQLYKGPFTISSEKSKVESMLHKVIDEATKIVIK